MSIVNAYGRAIRSFVEWGRLAGPKNPGRQWKDGRSAKELARTWTAADGVPAEVENLLEANSATRGFRVDHGIAEFVTRLDRYRGEHRNHDLLLVGTSPVGRFVLGVEAKSDEPFGTCLGDWIAAAVRRRPLSKVPERARLLCKALFDRERDAKLDALESQLLTALAGTIVEAGLRGADGAVLIVHEFVTDLCDDKALSRNLASWKAFIAELPKGAARATETGLLSGPFRVRGGEYVPSDIDVLIGKVATNLRTPRSQEAEQ